MVAVEGAVPAIVKHDLWVTGRLRSDNGLDLRSTKLLNLADPTVASDGATKAYADGLLVTAKAYTDAAVAGISFAGVELTAHKDQPGGYAGLNGSGLLADGEISGNIARAANVLALAGGTLSGLLTANGGIALGGSNISGGGTVTAGTGNFTNISGTLSTAAQGNITSLGTLTGLTVSGTATFNGALSATGQPRVTDATWASGAGAWTAGEIPGPKTSTLIALGGFAESDAFSGGTNQPLYIVSTVCGGVTIPDNVTALGRGGAHDFGIGGIFHAAGVSGFVRGSGSAFGVGVYGHAEFYAGGSHNEHAVEAGNFVLEDHAVQVTLEIPALEIDVNIDANAGGSTYSGIANVGGTTSNSVRGLSIGGNGTAATFTGTAANGQPNDGRAINITMMSQGGTLTPFWRSPPNGHVLTDSDVQQGGRWTYGVYIQNGTALCGMFLGAAEYALAPSASMAIQFSSRIGAPGAAAQSISSLYNDANGYLICDSTNGGFVVNGFVPGVGTNQQLAVIWGSGIWPGDNGIHFSLGDTTRRWVTVYSVNALNTSSRSEKQDIVPLDPGRALAVVRGTSIYEFDYRTAPAKYKTVGFLADEADPLLLNDDENVNPMTMAAVALAAIQALAARVEALEEGAP